MANSIESYKLCPKCNNIKKYKKKYNKCKGIGFIKNKD